jgi:hypothetical protein
MMSWDRGLRFSAIFKQEGSHRAHLHTLTALNASRLGKGLPSEGGDDSFKPAPGEANGTDAQFLATDPDALTAQDTLVGIVEESRTAFVYREIPLEPSESPGSQLDAQMFGDLLELANAAFQAMGTVDRVIGE